MRSLALIVVCHLLLTGVAFAGDAPSGAEQNSSNPQPSKKSEYKSSPRLNYSSKPKDESNGLDTLKPMLDQAFGNKDGSGGGVMPNAGTYKF